MRWHRGPIYLVMLSLVGSTFSATAADASTRNGVWTIGLLGEKHALKGGDGNEFIGNSSGVMVGKGYVGKRWFLRGTVDVVFGPFEPVLDGQFDVDVTGTGLAAWWGYSAQPIDLRDQSGGYGLAMGLRYTDVVGRSVGKNRRDPVFDEDRRVESYSLRMTNFSLIPSLFFSWLKKGRPDGSSPELLRTRIEGYFLTIGIAMPILASYTARLQHQSVVPGSFEDDGEDRGEEPPSQVTRQRGNFQGYTLTIMFSTLLGV